MRAALPSSDILSGHILLIPEEDFKSEVKVVLLLNLRNSIKSGYHYLNGNSKLVHFPESSKLIEEFNIYRTDIGYIDSCVCNYLSLKVSLRSNQFGR